jgi:predicted Fe-Mo cluster-binding NifX family protein
VGVDREARTTMRRRSKLMLKIAVPTNNGELISKKIIGSPLFLVYEIAGNKIRSRGKRDLVHGIMATIEDCNIVIVRSCPKPIRELLSVKGIRILIENRKDADRAVSGLLNRVNVWTSLPNELLAARMANF